MELPQLVVELVGDYSKLMEDIKKARVEAIKQAQFLEKDLNLTIGVNDDSLKNLNKHFDLKVTHFKQTQTYFKNNPLKVFVDDGELTNLNKELDKLGQRKVTANVSVNNNGSGNKNNTVGDVVKGVIMSPVNMAANIAMSPFRAVGKVADAIGKGIDNIAVGFTEEIGRSMSIKLTGKSTKQFAKKIQDGFRLVDEEIIGKSQVYETFFAELISSGSFDKAKFAAGKRTKMQKQLNRLGDLQVIANLEEEYKSNKNTPSSIEAVDRILSEEPELKKKFETISSKKSSLSLDEHKRRFIPTIIKEAQPTDLSNKVILPLMKEVQPILNFIQGMQSYHTSKLSESHYQARKATFPILEPGQKVVSVIGGAEDKFGQGGRALATSLEPIVGKNIKLLPVENLDTDVSKRTAEIDKWTDDVLIKKLLPGMGSLSPTIKNAVRQIAYSLNPLGSDVAAAQALAHTRLAREQGNDASAISFSLGGASAYRYAKAAEYEGTKTKALAMAYPFSNLSNATPKGFASAILEKDPLTFPFKIGVYNPSSAMNILDDSGLRSSGANVHATHHLFRSPGFVEKFNDTVGSSLPTDKTSRDTMSDLQRLMLQVHQVVISTMHAKDLASKGQYSQGVIKNLFDSKYLFGQLSNERMPEQVRSMATILRGQAVDAGTLMLSNAEKTERPTGQLKDLPNDESHPGYQRYKQEASIINQSIESFKTRTVVPGAYFAGGLKREDVAARNQELSQKTIPWFKSQKQFEEYGREIIKGLEIVAKLQEEFVRTHGNISPKFLDKIDYLPTENLKTDVMEKIKFPDNVTDPGFMRYVDEVSGINESIQTFKENKAIPDKGWWAGGLNVGKVAERKRDLSIATIPWFESQKQFEEYGKKIVQGFKVILSLQEEFIKTKGNISPDFLDKIEYLPTIPGSEKIPKYASEQSPEFRNLSEYFEENLNLKKLPISDAMREHPASILGFNKMLKTIAPMMPDAKEIKAVGHGWSGAMALITDKLVYKTDLDPEGAKKIASKQEVKAYERLQGRYAPLLYAANEKESMIVEKIEGRDLKKIMEDYAAPIRASKEEQAKLKKETKPRIAKLENELENEKNPERRKEIKKAIEDLENANKLLDRQIRKDIKQFNEIFSQFYRYVGSLGRAMQDMGVVHNDLASANVFFKDYKIDPVTNKVDPGKISAIDLGMSTTMPSAKQKAEDEATTIQRALIDISLWGILDANKIRNSIKKGYKKALPIPEARQIDPSLLIPLNPAKEIPIGYSGKSLLQETVGDLPQFKPTAILPTYTVEKSYTPTPVSTIPKGYQVIKVNPVTQSTSVSATPNGYQVTRVNPVTQSTSGKDIEVSEKAKLAVKSAQELAAKFNANFAKLRSLLKDAETTGNFAPVIELSAAIKQYGDKAKADITKLRNSAGIDPNFAKSRESSQLSNSLSQITSVQNKAARISALHGGVRIGENIGAGVSKGVENSIGDLRTSSEKLAETVIDTVEEKLEIKSPSRWAIRTGQNIGNAMGVGADESLNNAKKIITSRVDEIRKGAENGLVLPSGYNKLPHINKGSLANLPINGLLQPSSGVDSTRLNSPRTTSVFSAPTGEFSKLYNPNISTEELRKTFAKQISKNLSSVVSTDEINRSLGLSPVILPDSYAKYKKQNNVSPIITSSSQLNPYSGSIPLANPLKPYQGLILPNNNNSNNGNNLILPGQRSGSGLPLILPPEKQPHVVRLTEAQESFKNVLLSAGNAVTNFSLILPRGRGWSSPNPLTTLAASGRMGWAQGGYNSILPKNIPQPSYQSLILPNSNQNPSRHLILPNSYVPPIPQVPQPSISFKIPNTTVGGVNPQLPPFLPNGIPQVPQSTIENGVKKNSQSFVRLGIMLGKYVGEGFTKGLQFLEGGNNGIIPSLIRQINRIKESVENGTITSDVEKDKERLSRGFSKGLGSIPGFKEAKERFKGYLDFLKEIANPNVSAALGEGLANGIVAAKELFVDFLKMPEKIKEGFIQAKVAFDSFVEGMSKVQKFGEMMDFVKSSIGNVVKVLALLAVGKIILDLAPASIEVAANFENLERRIKFTSGSISEGAKNIAFLRSEAKRLNVDLSQTLESGSKFFQATKDTPIEGYQSRQIVSAVTQASAVYGLDLDKQQRTFTALEQMSGKTVVSQEELRQQLAEAIPNASQIAANAYGTTTQSMNQLLSTGRVLAEDFLPKFAQQLKAQTSSGVGDAVNSSVAITNKFNNSLIELQESIGKTLLPFRNFSLSVFASGIDLVTKNLQLLKSVLLITLIKLGSPVWLMFATYLKGILFSAGGAKGALLGMSQSIATLAAQMFVLSMAMKAIDETMMNFKDSSGAIGEQTRNVTQSINEQRKLLNPSSKVSRDNFSAFREGFTLNPFDNDTKKLIKQMEDSAKQTTIGQQNTFDILKDSNSPAIKNAIQDIQFLDKSLDNIKMERRAIIANDPGNSEALRSLQEWEKRISGVREKPLELFGGTKANLDKQVETLKTYLEYWEELKKNPKLYQSEIDDINKIIKVTEQDLATVIQEQDKMTKAIKNSLTEMQKFAIEIRNLEAKFNDLRQYRDTALSLEKTNLFNLGSSGDVLPGQLEYTNNLKTQATLTGKIADNLKQIQEMSAQLEVNDLDRVLGTLNLNKRSGIDTLKAAQERSIDGSKEKEILSGFIKVKEMQIQTVDMQQQIAEQKYNLIQSLYQQTKQVTDYYRAAVRESQAVGIEFEKAQKTFENSKVQNKLREALIGAGDNIYTQFIEGIINVISQTTEIEKQQLEARKQRIDYQNNVQDIQLQAIELQRSLPGKIIPIDSSIADNFNLSLKNVNRTVDEINKNINNLSNSVVDATKKAEDSIKDLSKTSNSWIEGLGTKFADLVKSFENGFDRVGTAIADMGIKTSNWLASLATGQGLLQNLAGGVQSAVSTVFGEKAGQQLEQGAKEFVSNPLGAVKKFYGLDNLQTVNQTLLRPTPGRVTSKYGMRTDPLDGTRKMHNGVDFEDATGTPIKAPLTGTVITSKGGWNGGAGNMVEVETITAEGKKVVNRFFHLSELLKKVGDVVQQGDVIGKVGSTGRGTGSHLHWEVTINGQRINPTTQLGKTFKVPGIKLDTTKKVVDTTQDNKRLNRVADWPMPQQRPTKQRQSVPLVPGLDPRIDTKFLQSVAKIAQSVGANPEDLLKTMLYETGGTLSPSARNKRTNATGLIQFMPATARGLGTNIDALSQMSPQEQLVFVQKYLKQNSRGQKLDSFRKVLSTVFAGNPNASLGVGDGDITLGNYLPKAENRYGNTARQLVQIVMQGGSIQPNQMQEVVTQASRLKLNTAAQQYQTNQTNSNLNPEQIRENELKQRLEAYRLIMSSQKTAIGDISSTKDSTLGTRITVLKGLSPTMSNADMFSLQFNELRRKLEKDVELLEQIVRETDGAIAQKPDLQAAFNLAMKRFPNDPRLAAAAIQTNDLSFKATAFKNAEAKNSLKFLKSNIDSILKASMKDFDKKEFFRLSEQDISQQSKVIEQLQQQLQLVQKLEEIDPLNPLVLKIPSLQRNISLLELTRDQYQQLLDLQRRYYDGGGKGGNMSEAAFQKEFKAILNVNSVKREGVDLNFNYADTVKRIKQANDELTKSQTIQASQMKSLQLDNERFAIDNKDGMVSLVSLTNELTIKTNELTNAYKKQLLEIQGNALLSPQEKLIERQKAFRNYGKEKSNLDAENSYQTKLAPITNRGIELTKSQTIQASQMKSLQLDNERFAIDNKDGMVSLVSLTNELTIKTNELTNAYKKQLLEIQGNALLSPQEKLIERLKAFRNYGKEKSNLDAENSYQTKLAPITNRGIELGRMEKLNSSGSAISSEIIRGRGLFGVRDKELQKAQLLSQIKMDFEKEKNEIAKLGLSSNYSAEEISVLSENLLKLNELKLDNVAKEFNMFTEAISGIKGDFDNILKGFFMNDSVNKNAGDLQDINKSLDEIAKKRRDIIMNTSGNIQEVRNAYQNSGNNKQLKELDRAQRDLEKKKTELSKRSIVDAFSEIAKSILSNLAAVASKELSNQLFGKLTEIIFGNKAKDVGAIALNNAGANLSVSATMLQQAALVLQNIMGAGSKDGGVLDSIFGAFGESSFGILEGSSAIPFSSSGAFDFSDGFSLGGLDGGLDFGSATLPSFAKGGMVGDLLNKERAISGFNPRLIIANEGERVLTPKETKLWNQLNSSNKLESFSSGGMIGEGLGNINNVGRSGDTINITPNVNINNSEGGNGNINKALFEKALEAKIQETIKQERRPGGSLNRGGLYDR
jgi:tape measure domain-containing protein